MTTRTFSYLGSVQTFVVPDQCTVIDMVLNGAGGGGVSTSGKGGKLHATFPVTPGDVLYVHVGGAGGARPDTTTGGVGGYGGGGAGGTSDAGFAGNGGGGATWISRNTDDLAHRIAVAGGGGGHAGGSTAAGDGGAATGQAGTTATSGATGGGGGTPSAGGAGGVSAGALTGQGAPGTLGNGGHGSNHVTSSVASGGGGGGGYYGGGGGGGGTGTAGGGGGGSNFLDAAGTLITTERGTGAVENADGSLTLTYNAVPNAPIALVTAGEFDVTQALTTYFTFTDPDPSDTITRADYRWRIGTSGWNEIDAVSYVPYITGAYKFDLVGSFFATYTDQIIEFQMRVYDHLGAYSDWSLSANVIPRAAPTVAPTFTPAITAIHQTTPFVKATTPTGLVAFEIAVFSAIGAQLGDVTQVVSGRPTVFSATLPAVPYVNGAQYEIKVRWQRDLGVWSPWATTGLITATITAPAQPVVILTPSNATASIRVDIVNAAYDTHPPLYNDIFRDNLDDADEPEIRIATGVAVNGSYTDFTPGSRSNYRYRVEAVNLSASTSSE